MNAPASYSRPQTRPLPELTDTNRAFWTGGEDGTLLIYRCHGCGRFFHPPAPACYRCRSTEVAPEAVSGRGTVATFTVNRQPWLPGLPPPYIIALVELAEQPDTRVWSSVVGVEPEQMRSGIAVEVFFEQWDDIWVPLFAPTSGGTA